MPTDADSMFALAAAQLTRCAQEKAIRGMAEPSRNQWEFYSLGGGWKPYNEFINYFLHAQVLSGLDPCAMNIDHTGDETYEWNFADMSQKRKLFMRRGNSGEWHTVATCSIRRIIILAAPERPQVSAPDQRLIIAREI